MTELIGRARVLARLQGDAARSVSIQALRFRNMLGFAKGGSRGRDPSPYSLKMLDLRRHGVKRRMAIDLVLGRVKKGVFIGGIARVQVCGSDHPDADSLVPPGVNVASILDCHLSVGCVQTAHVFMRESILAPNENFPQWPIIHKGTPGSPSSPGTVEASKQGNNR
jgi:hypothetical protein